MRTLLQMLLICFLLSACNLQPAKKPESAQTPPPTPMQQQHNDVTKKAKEFKGKVGIYAKNIKTSQELLFNDNDIFATASTHKLVVALAIYKYLYAEASDQQKQRYDRLILKMMEISDNPAFFELLNNIEHQKPTALTQVLTDLNLKETRIHSKEAFQRYGYHSVTTPREMAIIFETIYNSQYLPAEASTILKEELGKTIFKEEIPRHMQGSKVLHKVGQLNDGTLNDVGIVDDGKDQIVMSIFTKSNATPDYSSNFIAALSANLYNSLRSKQ